MKKLLPPLLWLVALVMVVYSVKEAIRAVRETVQFEQDTTRLFTQIEVDAIVRDSARAFAVRSDSVAKSLTALAERQKRSILQLRGIGDSLRRVLGSTTNVPDSLHVAIGLIETLQSASDSLALRSSVLEAIIALRDSQIVHLVQSERLGWRGVDSLQALIRRTPTCRKLPLLGVPVPRFGIGYAVTTGGQGVGIGVMVPLGKC